MIKKLLVAFTVLCLSNSLFANAVGDGVTVYNTLIDAQTSGAEFFVAPANSTVSETGLEFDDYLGLYDVDFTANSVWMGLVGNAALDGVPLVFPGDPEPRFDTYYYYFDGHDVTNVTLDTTSGDLAAFTTVGLVPAGDLTFVNESFTTDTDGFFVKFGPGADYSTFLPDNSLATVAVNFETQVVPEPSSMGIWLLLMTGFLAARHRQQRSRA